MRLLASGSEQRTHGIIWTKYGQAEHKYKVIYHHHHCQVLGSQVSVILATYVTAFLRH